MNIYRRLTYNIYIYFPGPGWGDGFKNLTMGPTSIAVNYGHNGATTSSFRSGGDWAKVLADVAKYAPTSTVYVTIQVFLSRPTL